MEFYGYTASEFAEKIDFNRSTISHLLSGRNRPSLEFVMKVLQNFSEVELDWLILGRGNFPSSTPSIKNNPEDQELQKTDPTPKPIDLFSGSEDPMKAPARQEEGEKKIERIVFFYTDGSFKLYEN